MSAGSGTDTLAEEPWEAEVGAMLGRLPVVEPPAGFIDAALDRPPLHAGRTLGLLGGLAVIAVLVAIATGVVGRSAQVPPVDELVARHDTAARAVVLADPTDGGNGPTEGADDLFDLPPGFRPAGTVAVDDIRQAVYAREDESVSVFVQDGRVAWSFLAPDGLTELGGISAWVDTDRDVAVLEVEGRIVTIVGLDAEELDQTLGALPDADRSVAVRATELAEAILAQFGYQALD